MRSLSALAAATLVACSPLDESDDALITDAGMYELMLSMTPDPPVTGDTTLSVMVHDVATGDMELEADLVVTPWMPGHDHGVAEDPVVVLDEGVFTVDFAYSMPGTWELTFDVDGSMGADSAVFEVEVQ